MCIFKTVFKTIVIGGVALGVLAGASVLVAGPQRTAAMFHEGRAFVNDQIDSQIDDTTAMRDKLRKLEREYPKRISQLGGDLAELREQMRQLDRERRISQRVVELTGEEIAKLDASIEGLETQLSIVPTGTYDPSAGQLQVRRDNSRREVQRVRQTQLVYQQRAEQAVSDLGYLEKQAARMEEALTQLENERTQFQTQLMQIERQIDAIDRNDRMIDMMEKRQKTLDQVSRYEAYSLDQVTANLSEIRSRQEAELEMLTGSQETEDFARIAQIQVDSEANGSSDPTVSGSSAARSGYTLAPVGRH